MNPRTEATVQQHDASTGSGSIARLGGVVIDSLSRSQRISSSKRMAATKWEPHNPVGDAWVG